MRTIKFRGKRIDNGKWAIGDLRHHNDCSVTIMTNLSVWSDNDDDVDAYGEELRVVPETVGQYTGLKDKKGKGIWEGDIVSAWSAGSLCSNGIIKWGKGSCRFFIGNSTNSLIWNLSGNYNLRETLEVIGNIHDNPELLKGGQNV